MTRNSKILSSALAIASLTLFCLEASRADDVPANLPAPPAPRAEALPAPLAPATARLLLVQTRLAGMGRDQRFQFELVLGASGEIEGIYYHRPSNRALPVTCAPDLESRQGCMISLADAERGLVLETYEQTHNVISLRTDPGFKPATGGSVSIGYLHTLNPLDPSGDQMQPFRLNVTRAADGTWSASHQEKTVSNLLLQLSVVPGKRIGFDVILPELSEGQQPQ